jgi:hypothetical protein
MGTSFGIGNDYPLTKGNFEVLNFRISKSVEFRASCVRAEKLWCTVVTLPNSASVQRAYA